MRSPLLRILSEKALFLNNIENYGNIRNNSQYITDQKTFKKTSKDRLFSNPVFFILKKLLYDFVEKAKKGTLSPLLNQNSRRRK